VGRRAHFAKIAAIIVALRYLFHGGVLAGARFPIV
jgi:hypothetical protein